MAVINPAAPCAFVAESLPVWTEQQHVGFKLVAKSMEQFSLSSGVGDFGVGHCCDLPGLLGMGGLLLCRAGGFQPFVPSRAGAAMECEMLQCPR